MRTDALHSYKCDVEPQALLIHVAKDGSIKHDAAVPCTVSQAGIKISLVATPSSPIVVHFDATVLPFSLEAKNGVSFHLVQIFSGSAQKHDGRMEVILHGNATGHFYQIAELDGHAHVEQHCTLTLDESSTLRHYCINLSEGQFKQTIDSKLNGTDAALDFYMLDQLFHHAHAQTLLTITHHAPRTKSSQLVRAIYGDKSNGIFLGKVVVEKTAPHTAAKQHYRTLLLSGHAKASVLPQLEINNHDITASHGATIGELDKEALFYLYSRGLNESEAKKLLVMALSAPVISTITEPYVASLIEHKTNHALIKNLGVANA